jgi:hypothetical protein
VRLGLGVAVSDWIDGGAGIPALLTNLFFDATGGSAPWSGADLSPNAIYNSSTNTTWIAFDAKNSASPTSNRSPMVCTYNHTTGVWAGPYIVGINTTLANNTDTHGAPTICRDSAGYWYCFYGSHATNVELSTTLNPDDPSVWITQPLVSISATFPRAFCVGSNIFLFYAGEGVESATEEAIICNKYTFNAGTLTLVSAQALTDVNVNTSVWQLPGNFLVNGTNIHCVSAYFQFTPTDVIQDVFYFIYDTTTGNVNNFAGSVSTVPASQPVLLSTLQASYRVVDQTDSDLFGGAPFLVFDTQGNSHILYTQAPGPIADGASLKHIFAAQGGSFSSPFSVFTWPDSPQTPSVSNCANACITQNSNGWVDAWFGDGQSPLSFLGAGFTTAGNMLHATFNGTSWSTPTQVLGFSAQANSFPLDYPTQVVNGLPALRVLFQQVSNGATAYGTLENSLLKWAFGEGGSPLARTQVSTQLHPETILLLSEFNTKPSSAFIAAIDAFIGTLIANNIMYETSGLWVPAAADAQSATLNWANPAFHALTVGGGAPSFTRLVGFSYNGTSDYHTSGLKLSVEGTQRGTASFGTLAAYFPSLPGTTNSIGVWDGSLGAFLQAANGTMTSRFCATAVQTDSMGTGIGFYSNGKTAATTVERTFNTTQVSTGGLTTAAVSSTAALVLGGINPSNLTQSQIGMAYMGFLSAANMLVLNTAFATYLAAIADL